MPGFNFLRRFTGNAVSTAAGYGIGSAMSPALEPLTQEVANATWSDHPNRPLSPAAAAEATIRDLMTPDEAATEAKKSGTNRTRFDIERGLAGQPPGAEELLQLWNRDEIEEADVSRGLRQSRLRPEWIAAVKRLRVYLPPVSDLVRFAVREVYSPEQRAFLDLDAEYPQAMTPDAAKLGLSERDSRRYWAAHWDLPSYSQAVQMLFRGELTRPQFRDLLKALDYAPTWRGPLETIARAIPTITDFQRLVRRGVYGGFERSTFQYDAEYPAAFTEKMALHGMTETDARDLWAGGWRVPSATQLYHMLWREQIDEGQLALGLKALDYSPFWRDKLAAIARPTPGRIDLRRMLQAEIITRAEAIGGYEKLGYTRADAVRLVGLASVTGATTSKGLTATDLATEYDARTITRAEYVADLRELGYTAAAAERKADIATERLRLQARRQLIARARTQYVAWRIDQPAVEQALQDAGLDAALASDLLASWAIERELNAHELTEAQIVKAFRKGFMDRNTALERLIELGLSASDVGIRLDA